MGSDMNDGKQDENSSPRPSHEVLRRLAEKSADLIVLLNGRGRITWVNVAARRVFDTDSGECHGRSVLEFVHPQDRDAMDLALEEQLGVATNSVRTWRSRLLNSQDKAPGVAWTSECGVENGEARVVLVGRDGSEAESVREVMESSLGRYRALLKGMLDPVVVINDVGTIVEANDSCERVFGYAVSDLLGKNIKILMPDPYGAEHDEYLANYRKTGRTNILGRTREFPLIRKDGQEISVELSVSRIETPGQPAAFCGSFRDITERKRVQLERTEEGRRFRAIFDGEFQFVGMLDLQGRLLEVNRTALEATGVKREEVVGLPFHETPWWTHCRDTRARVEDAVASAGKGEFIRFEVEVFGRTGNISLDFSVKPVCDDEGNVTLLIAEGRDITDLKRAQNRELSVMRSLAEIGRSASLLAHEIKNPITSVNLALRAVSKQLGADEREILEDLVWRMQKLEKTMRHTLSLTRPLELELEPLDVVELFESVVATLNPAAEEQGCSIEIAVADDALDMVGDASLLEKVLINLLRNSMDAVGEHGHVLISAESDGAVLNWRVEDNGPGMPEEVIDEVFRPFFSTKHTGTGLGLALSRKIIEAHGGQIKGLNRPEGGASFEIRLPRRQPEA